MKSDNLFNLYNFMTFQMKPCNVFRSNMNIQMTTFILIIFTYQPSYDLMNT